MSNPTEGRTFDLLPNIHCAPEICGACRRWLVETYTREVEAARQQGAREAECKALEVLLTTVGEHGITEALLWARNRSQYLRRTAEGFERRAEGK